MTRVRLCGLRRGKPNLQRKRYAVEMERPEEGANGGAGNERHRPATAKRKRKSVKDRRSQPPDFLFALTLAALSRPQHPSSPALINASLSKLHRLLFPHSSADSRSPLPDDCVLALLPLLLNSRCSDVVCTSLKILGAVSLISYELNEKIALEEGETLRLLLPKVLCGKRKVAMAACNAVLDVSSTSLGRQRLVHLSAINYLMLGLLQVLKSSTSMASLCIFEKEGVSCLGVQQMEDELPMLLLTAAVSLVNSCSMEQLERIPRKLMDMSVIYLKKQWVRLREQVLCRKVGQGSNCYVSNLTTNSVAETIFRLSLNVSSFASGITFDAIMRHIIGADNSSFQNFMLHYWESSSLVTRRSHMKLHHCHNVFDLFTESLNPEGAVPPFLSSVLRGMVSCVPLALDETDIFRYLNEAKELGCPILYRQDIRVVRTEPNVKREEHFFAVSGNNAFTMDDISRCEEAYKEGYTIALRGMEFRLKNIASVVDKVASLFGQPSVGANLYLTPPNSQGLACHFDDHCVFVCQLRGTKLWTIFPQPLVELPRLFDRLETPPDSIEGTKEVLLREGDVLYIPRGFPHKACTSTTMNEDSAGVNFSLHLTIAVEIEPPFEWEGFIHVALMHWSKSTKLFHDSHSCLSEDFGGFLMMLLHIAIRLLSNSESAFRKACLVAAASMPSDTENWLEHHQRSIFGQLIDKVNKLSSFSDALEYMKTSVQSKEDPFLVLRWLHAVDAEETLKCGFDLPLEDVQKILTSIDRHKESSEAKFVDAKARFCQEIVFDDVKERFKIMHAMFRKVRRQYMNGLLSLHY